MPTGERDEIDPDRFFEDGRGSRNLTFWPALLILTAGIIIPSASGQSVQKELQELGRPLRYEVSVTLKLIQVSVVDKKGRPVRDLARENFRVTDNGRPVEITAFERHSIRPAEEERTSAPQTAGPAAAAVPAMNRKLFFFFDFAFNNPRGIGKAKEAALDFLDTKVGPEDETAVLTYSMVQGLRVREYLTKDHGKTRETIEAIDRKAASGRASEIEEKYWRESVEALPQEEGSPSHFSWERQEAKTIAQNFILRLTDLAKALRYVPGRKDFLMFSSGVPSSMIYGAQAGSAAAGRTRFDAGDHVLRGHNESLLREFAVSDCTFYTFDTRESAKVVSLFAYDEQTFASGSRGLFSSSGVFADYNSVFKDEQLTGQGSLQRLSHTTGGAYFGNIDTYDRSLDRLQDLTGAYYVLGFSVTEKEDGVFHEVRVEVDRKGLEVRGAGGYFNPKPFLEFTELERKLHLFDLAMNERAFSRLPEEFPMKVLPVSLSDGSGLILLGRVPRSLSDKLAGGALELISLVLDEEDNVFDMQRVEAPGTGPGAFLFRFGAHAGPGVYRCRLVIRNTVTGAAAVSSAARTAIETGTGELRAQPIALFASRREIIHRLTAPGPRAAGPLVSAGLYPLDSDDLVPVMDEIGAGRELTAVVPCEVTTGPGPDLTVNAQLVDSAKGQKVPVPFFLKGRERRDSVQVIHVGIPAGSLGPGSYVLYVYLQDPASGARTHARIALNLTAD
ncbi:MAG: VWA domain-containing protein [Candidatus Aminicenantes bacterium]